MHFGLFVEGPLFSGGVLSLLGPEMETRAEDEEDEEDARRWNARGELKRPQEGPEVDNRPLGV
jgi:hypothetical protein